MSDKELQLETGSYTRIVNKVIDELVKAPLLGTELAICLFIIRKTYGYKKTEDRISFSQFVSGVKRSRPTIAKALKRLQVVNMVQLVKAGNNHGDSHIWHFNKYYSTWGVVNTGKLVKLKQQPSKENVQKLVKAGLLTIDNTKEKTIDREKQTKRKVVIRKHRAPKQEEVSKPKPMDETRMFFSGVVDLLEKKQVPWLSEMLAKLAENNPTVNKRRIWDEVVAFCRYWTERTQDGRQEKWESQKTFEVWKRLYTWFRRANFKDFQGDGQPKNKGRGLVE